MNEELLALFNAAGQRGEFKDDAGAKRWLNERGFDEYGKDLKRGVSGSPFSRGLFAGLGPIGVGGTAERLSRAFGMNPTPSREWSMAPGAFEEDLGLLGKAPYPLGLFEKPTDTLTSALAQRGITDEPSRQFSGGATTGAMATEVAKAYAAGKGGAALARTPLGARFINVARAIPGAKAVKNVASFGGRINPYSAAAIAALGAIEDIGSLPEESTPAALAGLSRWAGMEGLGKKFDTMSQSALGRGITGLTFGVLPEGIFLGAPKAWRGLKSAFGLADEAAPAATRVDVPPAAIPASPAPAPTPIPAPAAQQFPAGFSAGSEAAVSPDASRLLQDILSDLPPEPASPSLNLAGSRRRPSNASALREAVDAFRTDIGRGASRVMAPIETERSAKQILLRRSQENAAATTNQQKAAVQRMHMAEDLRLSGTPVGEALRRLSAGGAMSMMATGMQEEPSSFKDLSPFLLDLARPRRRTQP